ncbi:MAG: universal stress protein [Bacteroidales bacterium]|nr:universal stress protein [Bacteroidales bacterium]MBN2762511.1 universal stress protein [Bacteroidales bacterium]
MKTKIDSVLIPTDFSDLSQSALKVGIAIAKRQNAGITLLHVVDIFTYVEPSEVFLPEFKVMPDWVSSIEENLDKLAKKITQETGVKITAKVLEGQPADRICRYAFENKTNLIVMGTHGTSGLREFFIGSEAFQVVKNAVCPVLTIPSHWEKTDFEKVLFPIRLKPGALDKYFYSRPIIEKNNSELFLLSLSEKKKTEDLKELTYITDKLKVQLHNDNVNFQTVLSSCDDFPVKVIETANNVKADLIILTANLDYDFKAYFVGPFAQQVINHARLPVLSVKPANEPKDKDEQQKMAGEWGKTIDFSGL